MPSMIPEDAALACLPPKSAANAPPRYEYGPRTQNAVTPIATSGRSATDGPGRTDVSTNSAAAAPHNPRNIKSERPFRPSRSLSQPATNTDTAPTPGKIALMPAEPLML